MTSPDPAALPLTVVIKCGRDPRVVACLDSLPAGIEALVVVVESDPVRRLLDGRPDVRCVIVDTEDLGAKCNAGLEHASHDRVLIVDSDCTLSPGAVEAVAEALGDDPIVRCHLAFAPGTTALGRAIARWRDVENNQPPVPAYCPGLGIDRRMRDTLGQDLFPTGVSFTEDAAFDELRRRHGLGVRYLPNAVVHHDAVGVGHFIRSGYRTGYGTARQTNMGLRENHERLRWVLTRGLRGRFVGWAIDVHRVGGWWGVVVGVAWLAAYRTGYHLERLRTRRAPASSLRSARTA